MLTSSFILILVYYLAKIGLVLLLRGSGSNNLIDFYIQFTIWILFIKRVTI
jgi:hypothetical protein